MAQMTMSVRSSGKYFGLNSVFIVALGYCYYYYLFQGADVSTAPEMRNFLHAQAFSMVNARSLSKSGSSRGRIARPCVVWFSSRRMIMTSTMSVISGSDYDSETTDDRRRGDLDRNPRPSSAAEDEITVRWKTANGIVSFCVRKGETLRTAALRRGVVSPHNGRSQLINCRGLGTCGTCAVLVEAACDDGAQQAVLPAERNRKEQIRFSLPPHGLFGGGGDGGESSSSKNDSSKLRLACQIQVCGDLNVTKHAGFWGQYNSTLSPHNECQTYFGDLEYILDERSPPSLPIVTTTNATRTTSKEEDK